MARLTRRQALRSILVAGGGAAAAAAGPAQPAVDALSRCPEPPAAPPWRRGIEGQRRADLGDGRFLNPIVAGDRPDPSILKDGEDYYLTFSSFDAYPGVVIWHSRDLVNWLPRVAALHVPIGSVWACDLCKHDGRYFVYIPARTPERRSIWVIHAERIDGPWSEPIDLGLHEHIDPGHVVGEDGRRYLFLSGGDRVRLRDDGLAVDGPVEHVYDPWRYPEDWVVESFSPEGPKLLRHAGWYYLITAVGGTAGPPTGHMVIVARSRSIHGPWQDAPDNPILRTVSAAERWWSRGHATPVQGPGGDWWMVYHGYENGFWTLGRQTLLAPMRFTEDGWIEAGGGDLAGALLAPRGGRSAAHGLPLSDDFSGDRLGTQWSFYDPGPGESRRMRRDGDGCVIDAKGSEPRDASPLTFIVGDPAYRVSVDCEIAAGARAGLLLFYNRRLYCGLGFDERGLVMHRYGLERRSGGLQAGTRRLWLRIENDRHIVTIFHSSDGREWRKFGVQMEVSGYHHNVAGDFLSLRPALYVSGQGHARFRDLRYEALR